MVPGQRAAHVELRLQYVAAPHSRTLVVIAVPVPAITPRGQQRQARGTTGKRTRAYLNCWSVVRGMVATGGGEAPRQLREGKQGPGVGCDLVHDGGGTRLPPAPAKGHAPALSTLI